MPSTFASKIGRRTIRRLYNNIIQIANEYILFCRVIVSIMQALARWIRRFTHLIGLFFIVSKFHLTYHRDPLGQIFVVRSRSEQWMDIGKRMANSAFLLISDSAERRGV